MLLCSFSLRLSGQFHQAPLSKKQCTSCSFASTACSHHSWVLHAAAAPSCHRDAKNYSISCWSTRDTPCLIPWKNTCSTPVQMWLEVHQLDHPTLKSVLAHRWVRQVRRLSANQVGYKQCTCNADSLKRAISLCNRLGKLIPFSSGGRCRSFPNWVWAKLGKKFLHFIKSQRIQVMIQQA